MSSTTLVRWSFMALCGVFLIANIVSLVKDLLFYSRNGWDYTQDSGEKLVFSDEAGRKPDWVVPNEERVTYATPLTILFTAALICAVYFIPESWYEAF